VDSPGSPPRSPAAAAAAAAVVDLFGFDGIQNIRSGQIRHEISVIGGKSQAHLFCSHVVRGRLYVVMVMRKSGDMFCFFPVISGEKRRSGNSQIGKYRDDIISMTTDRRKKGEREDREKR